MTESFLAEGVEEYLGERLLSARPMGGGCIGEVYRVELEGGAPLVAKVDRKSASHLEREAYMLRYLGENSDLPVPQVFHGSQTLLLMEYVEGSSRFSDGGSLDQPNLWTGSWSEFFREQRLLYLARVAYEAGRLPKGDLERIHRLAERLDDYLEEPEHPSLVHGDVWSANVLAKGDSITAFLDPAIYHADPEVELAFISLFDSFGDAFFERYAEIRAISDGFFEERRDLYNLYPLLVHVSFFGGGYLESVRTTLRRLGL